jgi:putative membrane protein
MSRYPAQAAPNIVPGCHDDGVTEQAPRREPDGEPDYRMSLAAERTYLAYVRTALALLAGGVAVVGALPHAGHEGLRRVIGVLLVLVGLVLAVSARLRWREVDEAMRRGEALPRSGAITPVSVGVVLAAALALVLVLWV